MSKIEFSIIIPSYNSINTIENCLGSILPQIDERVEVIVVNDHSNDGSLELIESIQNNNRNLKVVNTEGKGVSDARNTGLKKSSGEYILFCDADDTFKYGAINSIRNLIEANQGVLGIIFGFSIIDKDQKVIEQRCLRKDITISSHKALEHVLYDKRVMGSVWNKVYKRDFLKVVRFDNTLTHCEDTHFNVQYFYNNKGTVLITQQLQYNFVDNPYSVTHDASKLFIGNELRYLVALNKINEEFVLTREKKYLESAMFKIATTYIRVSGITYSQRENLKTEIKKDLSSYIMTLCKFDFKENIKYLIKAFLYTR